jgi:hypothetical protein
MPTTNADGAGPTCHLGQDQYRIRLPDSLTRRDVGACQGDQLVQKPVEAGVAKPIRQIELEEVQAVVINADFRLDSPSSQEFETISVGCTTRIGAAGPDTHCHDPQLTWCDPGLCLGRQPKARQPVRHQTPGERQRSGVPLSNVVVGFVGKDVEGIVMQIVIFVVTRIVGLGELAASKSRRNSERDIRASNMQYLTVVELTADMGDVVENAVPDGCHRFHPPGTAH